MKKLETKHQVLEEKRQMESKVQTTLVENDDNRSQSTSVLDKSTLNWTPWKRDVSNRAKGIYNLLTPNQSTPYFQGTPGFIRYSHFSRYRNSLHRSSSVEDRDIFANFFKLQQWFFR